MYFVLFFSRFLFLLPHNSHADCHDENAQFNMYINCTITTIFFVTFDQTATPRKKKIKSKLIKIKPERPMHIHKPKTSKINKDLQGAGHNISTATIVQLRVSNWCTKSKPPNNDNIILNVERKYSHFLSFPLSYVILWLSDCCLWNENEKKKNHTHNKIRSSKRKKNVQESGNSIQLKNFSTLQIFQLFTGPENTSSYA